MVRLACRTVLSLAIFMCFAAPDAFTATVDLRPGLTPVKHQGRRNTCNVFGATGLVEFLLKEKTGVEYDLSEQYAYWLGKTSVLDAEYLKNMYSGMDGLAGFLGLRSFEFGMASESAWPYEPKNGVQLGVQGCVAANEGDSDSTVSRSGLPTKCFTGTPPEGIETLPYRITEGFVERQEIASYILTRKAPVVYNIMWYWDLVDGKTGEFTRLPTDEEYRKCVDKREGCSGHVILLVGYDTDTGKFLFRNSWGTGWGDGGYGTVSEEFLVRHCESCQWLENMSPSWSGEIREFVRKSSMGAVAELD